MAEILKKYFTEKELEPTFVKVAPERVATTPGKVTKAKVQAIVEALPYMGAAFIPAGKEEFVGVSEKKLVKEHNISVEDFRQIKREWEEARGRKEVELEPNQLS